MLPGKYWSIILDSTYFPRLLTWLPCWFSCPVFLCDTDMIDPFLIVKVDPLRELKLECTANAASTFHLRKLILPDFNVRHNSWTTTRYFISLSSLFQSTWLGCFTLVHKTAIVGLMSGLDLLHKNKHISTVVWNNYDSLLFRGFLLSNLNIF